MKKLQFKVTLFSDVIINQRAATEGNQQTLDFIPGNAFLGVAAGKLYRDNTDEAFILFHSGKVRFGDAHPLVEGKRALKVPASWYKKKDDKEDNELFVHHGMDKNGLKKDGNPVQVKQYREDFIVKQNDSTVSKVDIKKHFAIKSAYDSDKRRSEDARMYGYESLQAGSEWCFGLVLDDVSDELERKLVEALEGKRRIGRSSTAQYGLVEIKRIDAIEKKHGFEQWEEPKTREVKQNVAFVYAKSRLIFFDEYGQLTFIPEVEQLGLPGGKICWDMSQTRTFQYAPYNGKRQTRDTDRMGIEKGSVFCVTGADCLDTEKWVGSYQNEGFGKVLINPEFLEYSGKNGKAKYSFTREKVKSETQELANMGVQTNDRPVLDYLAQRKQIRDNQRFIYEKVNDFVKNNANKFKGENFASQWGTIRSLAMQFRSPEKLKEKIYTKSDSYLNHGVAAEKWKERGRVKLFENFVEEFNDNENLLSEAIINLSAEMAKKCRRN